MASHPMLTASGALPEAGTWLKTTSTALTYELRLYADI